MADAPKRACRFVLDLEADTRDDLASALFNMAIQMERGELTRGVSGGYSSGYIYELTESDRPTHDEWARNLRAYLDERQAAKDGVAPTDAALTLPAWWSCTRSCSCGPGECDEREALLKQMRDAAGVQEAPAASEPVAVRYKDGNGRWRYLNYPFTKGWAFPMSFGTPIPLYEKPAACGVDSPDGRKS